MENKLKALPQSVQERLDELVQTLKTMLAEDLVAVVVFGSAARGDYRAGESNVDLIVIVKADPKEKLAAIGPALSLARFSARIEAMILRADEIPRASDCFPLLYADVARSSVTLFGKSPFDDLVIASAHKRLRIEQELREARIRLRRVVSDMSDDAAFGRALDRKVKQLRGTLFALLELRGTTVTDRLAPVIEAACTRYGVEAKALLAAREDAARAYDALAKLLDEALADVDREDA